MYECSPAGPLRGLPDAETMLDDRCNAGEGGAEGKRRGVVGGVLPEPELPVLLVDDFLRKFLREDTTVISMLLN